MKKVYIYIPIVLVLVAFSLYNITKPLPVLTANQLHNKVPNVILAYEYANKYKKTFKKANCYCGCMSGKKAHESLLDCFKSTHGENCSECIEEALIIGKEKDKGTSDELIIKILATKYSS